VEKCGKVVGWKANRECVEPATVCAEAGRVGSCPLRLSRGSACTGDYEDPDCTGVDGEQHRGWGTRGRTARDHGRISCWGL